MTPAVRSVRFLRFRYDLADLEQTLDLVVAQARSDTPFQYLTTPNALHVVQRNGAPDAHADDAYDAAWLSTNDSRVLRRLARMLFGFDLGLATGSDLTAELFARGCVAPDTSITIVGGDARLEAGLRERCRLMRIARIEPPMGIYGKPNEIDRCARFIIDHPAPFVFVTISSPQSEAVCRRVMQMGGGVGAGLCIGSSLLPIAGLVRRPPAAMREAGLEWLYRLLRNPIGRFRRVFVESLPILLIVARARLRPGGGPA
jgi:N-acetylglucosaminyldiphosphoundecaprenol N-acetyl-beta-D-mannosaminyltransferase